MAKTKPLHWQEPVTAPCRACNGNGEWIGSFHSGPCAACDGTGLVGEDGEPLDQVDLLAIMRRQRDRQHNRLKRLWGTPGFRKPSSDTASCRHKTSGISTPSVNED